MSGTAGFRIAVSRLVAVGFVASAIAGATGQARAANWTATTSANWATGAGGGWSASPEGPGLTNHIANSGQLVAAPQSDNFGAFPLVSTTATLIQTSTTGDLRFSRSNYDFTIAPGAGNTLSWNTGLGVHSEATNNNSQNPVLANRVDMIVLAPVQIRANFSINNGGAAGQMKMMGDISQLSAGLTMTSRGNVVFGGSNSYSGQTTLASGSVVLDYGNSNATKFADTAGLSHGNGNVVLTLSGGSHAEVVNGVTFNNGAMTIRRSGGSSTLSAGALTFNAGSAVDFGVDSLVTTTSTNTRDILGGGVARATVGGATWATATGGAVVGLATYGTDSFSSNTNTDVTQSATLDGITTSSLRFNTAGGQTLTFSGNNTLQSGGILVTPNVGAVTTTITGGTLSPSGQMVIHQHNSAGILDIGSNINMAQGLVKTGAGTVRFSNAAPNAGAGAVSIHQGVVELNTAQNVFGTGTIRFDGGDIHNALGGNVTITNPIALGPDVAQGFFSRVGFGGTGTITLGNTVTLAGSSGSYKTVQLDVASGVTVITTSTVATANAPTLEKIGGGTFSVRGPGSVLNATAAPLVVREGVVQLSGSAAWTSAGANLHGGTLELNNETTNVNDRWSNVNAWGGELKLVGNGSVATSEALSTTFVRAAASTLTVESKGQLTDLQTVRIGQWAPAGGESNVGTTMLVRGTQLGSGSTGEVARIIGTTTANGMPNGFTNSGTNTPTASVIPWMIADDSATGLGKTLATFVGLNVGGNGYRPLLETEYATTPTASQNNRFSGSGTTTISAATLSIASLMLDGGRILDSSAGGGTALTVNNTGGAGIMSTGASNTIDSTVRLVASGQAVFHTVTDLAINGAVNAGTNNVVKSSGGTLTLSGTSDRSTGNTYVNQGVLKVANTNGLYDMSTFTGTAQLQRVITVWGRPGSDTGVLELAGVNWNTGGSTAPGIVLQGDNATLRGSGTASYGNGGAAYLSAYGDVFLEASGAGSLLTLDSPVSRDSGLETTINVKGAGQVALGAGAGNATAGTSRGNAEMDWYIGGSRNGNQGWLAVNASSAVGLAENSFYVANGGVLSGTGTIGSAVAVQSGVIAPGNSGIGTLSVTNDVTWDAGGNWLFQLGAPAANLAAADTGSDADLLSLTGAFTQGSGGTFTFDFAASGTDGWYKLVDYGSTTFASGSSAPFAATNLPAGKTATFVVDDSTNALYVQIVPEPGTLALLGVAGVGFLVRRMRRRAA